MKRIKEVRSLPSGGVQVRAQDDGELVIAGYGSVFNSWYPVYGISERVAPGAFRKTLKENPDIRGMFNHNPDFLLGRTESGTMSVWEDERGLAYEIKADPEDPQAVSVARKIKRGDVDGSSMAFFVQGEEWKRDKDGRPTHRTITEVELIETGPVTLPASPATSAKMQRALGETGIDFEALTGLFVLRRAGFDLTEADQAFVARTIERLTSLKSEPAAADARDHLDTGTVELATAAWALNVADLEPLLTKA